MRENGAKQLLSIESFQTDIKNITDTGAETIATLRAKYADVDQKRKDFIGYSVEALIKNLPSPVNIVTPVLKYISQDNQLTLEWIPTRGVLPDQVRDDGATLPKITQENNNLSLTAPEINYTLDTQDFIARGTTKNPVTITQQNIITTGQKLIGNIRSEKISLTGNITSQVSY